MTHDAKIELISPPSLHKPAGYSHLAKVNAGSLLLIAGQVAMDVMGNIVAVELSIRGTFTGPFETPAGVIAPTGATITVPLFVNIGDRVRVDTRSGKYVSRA